MAGLVPVLVVALFAGWCGTFPGSAEAWGAAVGQVALLAAAMAARSWDPLRLGPAGKLLPLALLVAVLASWWASPVSRAGRVGLTLLPAFLLLPAAVERWWADDGRRRLGLRALTVVCGAVAGWSIVAWLSGASVRPAVPLGHHNLLAAWLVILLPLVLVGLRDRGLSRGLAATAGGLAILAVLLSRSFTGLLALAAEGMLATLWLPRWRRLILPLGLLALLAGAPRLAQVLEGADASTALRSAYLEAGWEGFTARPLLGWGPGSVPWTAGSFLRPRPGVTPPGEVVGQLHALPLDLAYELGATGLLIALGLLAAFVRRRLAERRAAADCDLAAASLAGLLGAGVAALGNAWLAVPALPVAVAVVAGAGLAAGRRLALEIPTEAVDPGTPAPRTRAEGGASTEAPQRAAFSRGVRAAGDPSPGVRIAAAGYGLAAVAVVLPLDLAQAAYDRAAHAGSREEVARHLARAADLDPMFPLYTARLAWYLPVPAPDLARKAAEGAPGVAMLWLSAGVLSDEAGVQPGRDPLRRALALDPLSGLPAYYLAKVDPDRPEATDCAARALLGEPRLAAATMWDESQGLRQRVRARILAWEGVDPGWREAMAAALIKTSGAEGRVADLAIAFDDSTGGLSLHGFRRRPWGAPWFSEPVDTGRLALLTLPPAAVLPTSHPKAFPSNSCAPSP